MLDNYNFFSFDVTGESTIGLIQNNVDSEGNIKSDLISEFDTSKFLYLLSKYLFFTILSQLSNFIKKKGTN